MCSHLQSNIYLALVGDEIHTYTQQQHHVVSICTADARAMFILCTCKMILNIVYILYYQWILFWFCWSVWNAHRQMIWIRCLGAGEKRGGWDGNNSLKQQSLSILFIWMNFEYFLFEFRIKILKGKRKRENS